jgi:hypothetical protein
MSPSVTAVLAAGACALGAQKTSLATTAGRGRIAQQRRRRCLRSHWIRYMRDGQAALANTCDGWVWIRNGDGWLAHIALQSWPECPQQWWTPLLCYTQPHQRYDTMCYSTVRNVLAFRVGLNIVRLKRRAVTSCLPYSCGRRRPSTGAKRQPLHLASSAAQRRDGAALTRHAPLARAAH